LAVTSALPDGRSREPEYPSGIGRIWGAANLPPELNDYLMLVRRFNERQGAVGDELKFYPGSPWIAKFLLRPQDRMALCELRADDAEALDFDFARESRVKVQAIDGYTGLKAMLPPPEKRALVLIDPPFESKAEFTAIRRGLSDAMRRLPGAVGAVWYPITERARADEFHDQVRELETPALAAELNIAGENSALRMKGCGLLILNPPWQIEREIRAVMPALVERLKADSGATSRINWVVPEK
jgi:23S rRNA (adenine2030-N6)-methyltransferase